MAFHVLVGIYFLWLIVCGFLLVMAFLNEGSQKTATLHDVFKLWIFLNLFMGFVLFTVIRLFKNKTILNKVILFTFIFIVIAAIATVVFVK